MAVEKRRTDDKHEFNELLASTEINSEIKREQKALVIGPANAKLGLTFTITPAMKCWITDLKGFNFDDTTMGIIERLCHESFQLLQGRFEKLAEQVITSVMQSKRKRKQNFEESFDSNFNGEVWGSYLPPIEGSPILIRNNRMQVTRRSLPYIVVAIKRKLIPAIIDPSVSLSFICNDVYNIYVQSHYSEEEIRYSQSRRKREVAYCWWSPRRALVTRAHIKLPIRWETIEGGVADIMHLNLIQPNPGLINGFIVLGKDFYTKYVPSFCLSRNSITISPLSNRDLTIEMTMNWSSVIDFIPIADRRKGAVYFIDRYEKNLKYCRRKWYRRQQSRNDLSLVLENGSE